MSNPSRRRLFIGTAVLVAVLLGLLMFQCTRPPAVPAGEKTPGAAKPDEDLPLPLPAEEPPQ